MDTLPIDEGPLQQQQQQFHLNKDVKEEQVRSNRTGRDSHEEAFFEMLGLSSQYDGISSIEHVWNTVDDDEEETTIWNQFLTRKNLSGIEADALHTIIDAVTESMKDMYEHHGYFVFDSKLSVSADWLRKSTEQLVWGRHNEESSYPQCQRVYERIGSKCFLTRFERFCYSTTISHASWNFLAIYVGQCLSVALGEPYILFKEKLNLKPPQGAGFAPHLDTPSLLQWDDPSDSCERGYSCFPSDFVTVMVAIDDMKQLNGCLRIAPGAWNAQNAIQTVRAGSFVTEISTKKNDQDGTINPDAGGRKGLIPPDMADTLSFIDIVVRAGTMVAFSGYTPHRSGTNRSHFARRAVFFTYNPVRQGNHRDAYYHRMQQLRDVYKITTEATSRRDKSKVDGSDEQSMEDARVESQALTSIPRI